MKKRRFFPPPSEPLSSADGGWDRAGLSPQHCMVRLEPNPSSKEQKKKKKTSQKTQKIPNHNPPTDRKPTEKKPKQRLKKEQRPVFALTPLKAQFEDP